MTVLFLITVNGVTSEYFIMGDSKGLESKEKVLRCGSVLLNAKYRIAFAIFLYDNIMWKYLSPFHTSFILLPPPPPPPSTLSTVVTWLLMVPPKQVIWRTLTQS